MATIRLARTTVGVVAAVVTTLATALLVPPAAASGPGIWDEGRWLLRSSFSPGPATSTFSYGRGGDFPVMGDWDGSSTETVGVARYRPGVSDDLVWHLRDASSAGGATVPSFTFGQVRFVAVDQLGTIPVVGDWDGDGVDTVGVVRYSDDVDGGIRWELRNSNTAGPPDVVLTYGRGRDVPVVGDWDGNGTDTPGLRRSPNRWLLRNSSSGGDADLSFAYGSGGGVVELPVVGDWDDDGTDTVGLLRNEPASKPEGGFPRWLLRNGNSSGPAQVSFLYGNDSFFVGLPVDLVPRLAYR